MDIAIMSIYKTEFFDPLKKKRHNRTDAIILKTELVRIIMKSFDIIAIVILSFCIHIFEAKPRVIFLSQNFPRWYKLGVYNN